MNGLFLQGGGAKGAFQAGVIYGLKEQGIDFHVIAGTSIGAMNAYCLYAGRIEQLKEMWLGTEIDMEAKHFDKVFENNQIIALLSDLQGRNEKIRALYVNYVEIENSLPKEVVVDLTTLDRAEQLEAVKYSSLLPIAMEREMTMMEIMQNYDSNRIFGEFQEGLMKGDYDGFRLDGGIANNNLLSPFVENKVERLFLIPFEKEYRIPDYITEVYDADALTIIAPVTELHQSDVLRFEKEFCAKIYREGYEIGRSIQF